MKPITIVTLTVICICTATLADQTLIDKVPFRDVPLISDVNFGHP